METNEVLRELAEAVALLADDQQQSNENARAKAEKILAGLAKPAKKSKPAAE